MKNNQLLKSRSTKLSIQFIYILYNYTKILKLILQKI